MDHVRSIVDPYRAHHHEPGDLLTAGLVDLGGKRQFVGGCLLCGSCGGEVIPILRLGLEDRLLLITTLIIFEHLAKLIVFSAGRLQVE